jgi:hypothetical protein
MNILIAYPILLLFFVFGFFFCMYMLMVLVANANDDDSFVIFKEWNSDWIKTGNTRSKKLWWKFGKEVLQYEQVRTYIGFSTKKEVKVYTWRTVHDLENHILKKLSE